MKVNNFLHLVGGVCLLLQGCETWHSSNDQGTSNLDVKSTVMGTTGAVEQAVPAHPLESTTQLSKQNFRAQPRRPILEKQPEEEVEEASQPESKTTTYTVQKGDTLYKIARNFNVTVAELTQVNGLQDRNRLSVGMELTIPDGSSLPTNTANVYVVQKGDTLTSIANRFQTSVASLKQSNKLTKDTIYVGQKLYVSGVINTQVVLKTSNARFTPINEEKYVVKAGDVLYNIAKRCGMTVQALMQMNNIQDPKALQIGQVLYLKKAAPEVPLVQPESTSSASNLEPKEKIEALSDSHSIAQNTSVNEEENFEDLFEEGNDIPVVPLEDIK